MKLAGMGQLDFTLNGTLLRKLTNEPITGLGTYDCAGLFGASCGTPSPKCRHKLRTTWTTPWNMGLSATWRSFGAVKNELTSDNPFLSGDAQSVNSKFKASRCAACGVLASACVKLIIGSMRWLTMERSLGCETVGINRSIQDFPLPFLATISA